MAPLSWVRMPRRTLRLRLTALYGTLFLVSGAVLLAITYALVAGQRIVAGFRVAGSAQGAVKLVPTPPARVLLSEPVPGKLRAALQNLAWAVNQHAVPAPPGFSATVKSPAQVQFTSFEATLPTPGELHRFLLLSAVALAIMAVGSIGLGWLVAGRALRPLRTMTATARQISEKNLNERLSVRGPEDELKDLGDTIDGLLGRLETAFEAQRRFVANASHELRTPLAMMRTSLDVAMGKPAPVPPEVSRLAGKLEEGLDQADRLLEGLLVLTRAQQGAVGEMTVVRLDDLVRAALDGDRQEIAGRGLAVTTALASTAVMGNATLLSRMVANVVDNAVRHNVAGGPVKISSEAVGGKVRLVVESGGRLLSEEQLRQLGEPFFRPGAERLATGSGAGLGLSIVKAIAGAHGGAVGLRARPEGGLIVTVELPAALVPA